jgi:hypothetical protein
VGKVKFKYGGHRCEFVVFGKRPISQGGNCDACDAALLVAQAQVVTLTGQLVTANASIQTLTTDLATANAQIVVDTALIASLTAQLAAANATIAALNSQITTLNAQIVALNAVIASLTGPFYVRSFVGTITTVGGGVYIPPSYSDVTVTLSGYIPYNTNRIFNITTVGGGFP